MHQRAAEMAIGAWQAMWGQGVHSQPSQPWPASRAGCFKTELLWLELWNPIIPWDSLPSLYSQGLAPHLLIRQNIHPLSFPSLLEPPCWEQYLFPLPARALVHPTLS